LLICSPTAVGQVDATDPSVTSYNWSCPSVSPPAPIYFYQFSSPYSTEPFWSGRFTIAAADGQTVAAPEVQFPGEHGGPPISILWGNATIDQADVSPPPTSTSRFGSSSAPSADITRSAQANNHASSTGKPNLAGLVAGGAVGGLILIGVLIWVVLRGRRRRRGQQLLSRPASPLGPMKSDDMSAGNARADTADVRELALGGVLSIPDSAHRFSSPAPSPRDPFADDHAPDVEAEFGNPTGITSTFRNGVLSIPDPAGGRARLSQGLAFAKLALEAEEVARAARPSSPARRDAVVSAGGLPVASPGGMPGVDSEVELLRRELERVRAERDAERAHARELALASGDVPPAYHVGAHGTPANGTDLVIRREPSKP
jgi:hypothetical protein